MAVKIGDVKISNSYRGLRFTVKKTDIENGQPNDPCACAAARALKREAHAKEAFVYRNVTYVVKKDGAVLRYRTPPSLRLETIVFDRNGAFHAGEYELEAAPLAAVSPKVPGAVRKSASTGHARRNAKRPHYSIPDVRPTASQRLHRV